MNRRSRAGTAYPVAVAVALLAGCVSDFELSLPAEHPARPEAGTGGELVAPSPFDLAPAEAGAPAEGEGNNLHGGHGGSAPEPMHGEHEGGRE